MRKEKPCLDDNSRIVSSIMLGSAIGVFAGYQGCLGGKIYYATNSNDFDESHDPRPAQPTKIIAKNGHGGLFYPQPSKYFLGWVGRDNSSPTSLRSSPKMSNHVLMCYVVTFFFLPNRIW